ncbi:MAG: protein kinase [Anaerolineae bacterium]|nr:protein kinase [Anaerolineae bacterium]
MTTLTELNQTIGRYRIEESIGAGGMARVFKAWDTTLDRPVAIKVLHEHLAADPTFKERFEREAKVVASLNHPNIVQIYDYGTVNNQRHTYSYMVMPYIPGKTLKDVLEEMNTRAQRLDRNRILTITRNLAEALTYAHGRGMVHRDVKPGNILFNEQNQAVLADFGIARLAESAHLTQEGATVGTPAYLSPEQAAGIPVDARSDIYALGIILYEMLTGYPPFAGESTLSIILKHLNEPVPSLAEQVGAPNPDLDTVILKALTKNPQDRYQTANNLAADLERVFTGKSIPVATKRITQTSPMVIAPPKRRRLSPVLLVVVGIIGVLILLAVTNTNRPPALAPTTEQTISSMTGDEGAYFLSTFNPDDITNSGWPRTTEGSIIRQITPDGVYRFENHLPGAATTSIFTPRYVYQDATITLEATLEESSPATTGYGIVFRHVNERNYDVFAVDGIGRYSLWSLRDGIWHELRDSTETWMASNFVNTAGQTNQLTITFLGDHLIGAVNSQIVVDLYTTEPVVEGAVGLYLATPPNQSNPAILSADNYQVSSDVPSMTGG